MYGLIGQILAQPGERSMLQGVFVGLVGQMPGCVSYVVAEDRENPDALWITEVWDSQEHHAASLELPVVKNAIALGRPHIVGFGHRFETTPVTGV